MANATIPVTISAEANELAANLGLQTQLDQMIDRAMQTFPNLLGVETVRVDLPDEPELPRIVIRLLRAGRPDFDNDYVIHHRQWCEWTWEQFPPPVYATIGLRIVYPEARRAR